MSAAQAPEQTNDGKWHPLLRGAAVGFLLTSAILLCFAVQDDPLGVRLATNSDTLLPASFVWDLLHRAHAWRTFQLPRIPSIFPDLTVFGALDIAFGNFRYGIFGYAIFQCLAFVWVAGLVISWTVRVQIVHATALFLALIEIVILVDLWFSPISEFSPSFVHYTIFTLVEHFAAFLMSLVCLLLVMYLLNIWQIWIAALLTVCCYLAFLSDRIFMFEFVGPIIAALLVLYWADLASMQRVIGIGFSAGVGIILGAATDLLLTRQPNLVIEHPLVHIMSFWTEAPNHFRPILISVLTSLAIPYVAIAAYFVLARRDSIVHQKRLDLSLIVVFAFAACAVLGTLVLGVMIYTDMGSYRYVIPVAFWPLILVGVVALRLARGYSIIVAWCLLLGTSVALAQTLYASKFVPRILVWQNALASCLLEHRERFGLQEGLAQFWLSRPATIGTNWSIQVDQITGDGSPFYWGNDPQWYRSSIKNPELSPKYNFIVIDRLDPAAIRDRYGAPARTEPCNGYTLWIYDEPLNRTLLK